MNLGKIKGETKGVLWYGNLLVCSMLFFFNEIPGLGKRQWAFDIPLGRQIKGAITGLGNLRDDKVWGYLKSF